MASIDPGVVQQMFGEDLSLFEAVMAGMLREYADLALPTRVSLADSIARGAMMARAHKLKGSAGMLGATRVMQLAAAAENALHNERPVEVIERILCDLAAALTTLRGEAQGRLQPSPRGAISPASTAAQCADDEKLDVDIEELRELLERHNLKAVDTVSEYAPSLSRRLGVDTFERLREAIVSLEFDHAAALLRDAV
jgi:HPt (histidine-containing phosphotransfer) domain-containing protein